MTDLATPELRRFAWETFDCGYCDEHAGRRCKSPSGARVTPHLHRLTQARAWLSRQPEVDELREGIARRDAIISGHADELRTLTGERDRLKVEVQAQALEISGLSDQVRTLERDLTATKAERDANAVVITLNEKTIASLRARIAELEGKPGPPPTSRMYFGACPMKPGGASLAAQKQVVDKWGEGAAVRQFLGGISTVAPRDPRAGIVHVSWKEYTKANLTAAKVKAALVNLNAGDVVEDGHESDNDGLSGAALEARIDIKNTFYDLVKQVRPDLLVCHTFTAWLFEPKSGKLAEAEMWLSKVRADIIGLDCDGIRPLLLPYTDYQAEFKAALPMLEKYKGNGYKWISIPEFGCPRIPTADPDGSIRAAYHDFYANLWKSSGKVLMATLYEYDSNPNYSLSTAAEISGWRKHV